MSEQVAKGTPSPSVSGRILRGASWMTLAGILARVGTFTANLVVIRMLGLERMGQLGLIESWLSLATMFALFGLGMATTRFVARFLESETSRVGEVVGAAFLLASGSAAIVALLVFGGVHLFAPFYLGGGESGLIGATLAFLVDHSWLFVGLIFMAALREISASWLQGLQSFRFFLYLNLFSGVVSLPLYYILTQSHGVAGVFTARLLLIAAEMLLAMAFAWRLTHRLGVHLSFHRFIENARALFAFALPTFLGQVIANPVKTFMVTLLAAQPGGAIQVGLLTTAGRLVGLASFLPGAMTSVLMPILATVWGQDQGGHFRHSVSSALRMLWLVSLPALLFFMAATPLLLGWLFGSAYVKASAVTFMMLGAALLTMINETSDRTLAAANRQWLSTGNNVLWVVFFLALGLWLTPTYLAVGYAIAFLISFGLYVGWQLGVLRAVFQIPIRPVAMLACVSCVFIIIAWLIAEIRVASLQFLGAGGLMLAALLVEWYYFLLKDERWALRAQAQLMWARAQALLRGDRHPMSLV